SPQNHNVEGLRHPTDGVDLNWIILGRIARTNCLDKSGKGVGSPRVTGIGLGRENGHVIGFVGFLSARWRAGQNEQSADCYRKAHEDPCKAHGFPLVCVGVTKSWIVTSS